MSTGYPGVPNNPNTRPREDEKIEGRVLGSDALHDLVRQTDGTTVIVNKKTGKRAGG